MTISKEQENQVVEMKNQGKSFAEIQKETGVAKSTAHRILKRNPTQPLPTAPQDQGTPLVKGSQVAEPAVKPAPGGTKTSVTESVSAMRTKVGINPQLPTSIKSATSTAVGPDGKPLPMGVPGIAMGPEIAAKGVTNAESLAFMAWDYFIQHPKFEIVNEDGTTDTFAAYTKKGFDKEIKANFIEAWTIIFTVHPDWVKSGEWTMWITLAQVHIYAIMPRITASVDKGKYKKKNKKKKTTEENVDEKRKSIAARPDDKKSKAGTDVKRKQGVPDEGKGKSIGSGDKPGVIA